jgi:hypothetical protein
MNTCARFAASTVIGKLCGDPRNCSKASDDWEYYAVTVNLPLK